MPFLRDDLLQPIPGPDPKGENLKYSGITAKIQEALAEESDDSPQGEWSYTRKKADLVTAMKLAGDALAKKSKDLQMAAFLAEAAIGREGLAVVPECLQLLLDLQTQFWDNLYPELEDGNPVFRRVPQEKFAAAGDLLLRRVPLTKKGVERVPLTKMGLDWYRYKESRSVGYPAEGDNEEKKAIREAAMADGKITAEEFDKAFESTPKKFYVEMSGHIESAQASLAALESFCNEKYKSKEHGDVSPSFGKLHKVLADLQETVGVLLRKKRENEPDEAPPQQAEAPPTEESESEVVGTTSSDGAPRPAPQLALQVGQPASPEDAIAIIGRMAAFLRQAQPASVVPYLLTRSLRWGELRSAGDAPDQSLLVAPSSEVRQNLKRLYVENQWDELLECAETAVASPCGRAWLDLHRYAWQACQERSYYTVATAIGSELKALLADFPALPDWELNDGTPVANSETKNWLHTNVAPPAENKPAREIQIMALETPAATEGSNGTNAVDPFETAMQLAKSGQLGRAMEVLRSQSAMDGSGRERFLRQLQVSQLCLSTGNPSIAHPILNDLYAEIERRKLMDWERTSFIVQPLALLLQCIDQTSHDQQQRSQIYNLLCRLEPAMALQLQNSGRG